jgi:hypothetical protein
MRQRDLGAKQGGGFLLCRGRPLPQLPKQYRRQAQRPRRPANVPKMRAKWAPAVPTLHLDGAFDPATASRTRLPACNHNNGISQADL